MTPREALQVMDGGALPLDLRTPRDFVAEHLPGAVSLHLDTGELVAAAERLLPKDATYLLHATPERAARLAVGVLRDAGYQVAGHLEGGLTAWQAGGYPIEELATLSVEELKDRRDEVVVVDVREPSEFRGSHIPGALPVPWTESWVREDLPGDRTLAVVCDDGVRSATAASILKRAGYRPALVIGGMIEWTKADYPTETVEANSAS